MYPLNGLEPLAFERVEEMRVRAEHERLLRSLPRREGWLRMAARTQWSRMRMALGRRSTRMEQFSADFEALVSHRSHSEPVCSPVAQERRRFGA